MQKICIISFDHWDYDKHIVTALQKKGVESFHIKIGGFKHKNSWSRLTNTLSKLFFNKNPKLTKRQDYIIESLKNNGFQDQILVINPELIDLDYHLQIKEFTCKYIAYLYDSVDRCPITHLLDNVFDEIYSFDSADILKYGFKETTNYNYIETLYKSSPQDIKNDVLYIASFDNRINIVFMLKSYLEKIKCTYRFIIVGKKTTLYKLKNIFSPKIKLLDLRKNRIRQEKIQDYYKQTKIIIDLVRPNQTGISFRIFEAMAFEKKIITNNKNILNFNFYNPNNITVIDVQNIKIEIDFFESSYESLPEKIYNYYTISAWVDRIFNLN